MKQAIVGVYGLGADQVELVLREGTGGEFYVQPEKAGYFLSDALPDLAKAWEKWKREGGK